MIANYTIKKMGKIFNLQAEYITLDEIESLHERFVNSRYQNIKAGMNLFYVFYVPRTGLVCGEYFDYFDAHHAICTKNDAAGWKYTCGVYDAKAVRRLLIDTELNLTPLHHKCHMDNPPTKQKAWEQQCNIYGEKIMNKWFESLPWKLGKPPEIFNYG